MSEHLCPIHNIPMELVVVNQPTMAYGTRLQCRECERMKNVEARWNERRFTAAVAAMQGMWADYRVVEAAMPNNQIGQSTMNAIARLAVMQAAALLKELEK